MHDGMQYYEPIQGQGQGYEPLKVGSPDIFKSDILRHLQWELATDHGFLNYGTMSKSDRAEILIFDLVFVSRDFEVGRNVSSEESAVSPVRLPSEPIQNLSPGLYAQNNFRQRPMSDIG